MVQDPRTGNYTVTFHFSHGNPGGTFICFVRDLERCPVWRQEVSCEQLTNITFTGLLPGVWFSCGVRCSQGGIQRQITRSFPTPLVPTDCDPRLINDGISFVNYTISGDATTCFEWASSGSATEFECRIDSGMPFSCTSPLCVVLSAPDQHTIRIIPEDCAGEGKVLFRRFEVPAQGCALPFSFN